MNKTVTINISGIIFHIEEDAYAALQNYISAIKVFFTHTEGGTEIMADIEARIAELLQGRISPGKQVVVMADVTMVMETMGRPEQFASADETQSARTQTSSAPHEKIKRRLFRDPEEKAIGGVCSGLAAYFDIDVVWVRLATFLLIFFGGLSLWVYIILWIVIPEARSTADRFAMRGEPANVNTIFRSFQEEAEDVKSRMHKYGQDFKDKGYNTTLRDNFSSFLHTAFSIIGRLFGLLLVLIGGALLLAYAASLMGISLAGSDADFEKWRLTIFASQADYALAVFAFALVIGIPVIMIVYSGIKLLFRLRYRNRWLNLSLGILWTIGFVIGLYVTVVTFKQFSDNSRTKETLSLSRYTDTLTLKMNPDFQAWKDMNFENDDAIERHLLKNKSGYLFGQRSNQISIIGSTGVNIMYTEGDSASMVLVRSARGENKRDAKQNAKAIQYNFRQQNNILYLDRFFIVDEAAKFRMQDLSLQLFLPLGTIVKLDPGIEHFLDDVENTSNTWDGDMAGRRWRMTERGLECIDCQDLETETQTESDTEKKNRHPNQKLSITGDGIRVRTNEDELKIDGDGIRIETLEKEVKTKSTRKKNKD